MEQVAGGVGKMEVGAFSFAYEKEKEILLPFSPKSDRSYSTTLLLFGDSKGDLDSFYSRKIRISIEDTLRETQFVLS